MNRQAAIAGLLLAAWCFLPAQAAAPAEQFAGQIQRYRESASAARDALASLMSELKQAPAFSKVDGPLITAHLEDVAGAWTEVAAALEKGDETKAAALAQRAQKLAGPRDRWQERVRWRLRQAQLGEYMPATAEVFFTVASDRREEDVQELEALMEAKKRRSEAYGRLAEATTPSADSKTLFKLQDEVFAADVEVGVADMRLPWANEDWGFRTFLATDPTITSPELTAAKQRLAEWRHQREETYRQSRSQQHALEQLDREAAALVAARESAYRAAKAAREPAKKSN
jgi:hypothetical protein